MIHLTLLPEISPLSFLVLLPPSNHFLQFLTFPPFVQSFTVILYSSYEIKDNVAK
jgi:hypothetical protein